MKEPCASSPQKIVFLKNKSYICHVLEFSPKPLREKLRHLHGIPKAEVEKPGISAPNREGKLILTSQEFAFQSIHFFSERRIVMTRNFYFSHPIEAMFDPRMEAMEEVLHGKGYGIYWYIREKISFFAQNRCRLKALKPFATRYFTYPLMVWVVTETGLFDIDGEYVTPRKLACELGPDAEITVPEKLKPAPKTKRKAAARNSQKTTEISKKTTKNNQNPSISDENRTKNDEILAKNCEFSSKNDGKSTKISQKSAENGQKRGEKARYKTIETISNESFSDILHIKSNIDKPYIYKEKKKEREKDYYCCCRRRKRRRNNDHDNNAVFILLRPVRAGIRGSHGASARELPRVYRTNASGFVGKCHGFCLQTPGDAKKICTTTALAFKHCTHFSATNDTDNADSFLDLSVSSAAEEPLFHSPANGIQPELFGTNCLQRHKEKLGGIVHCPEMTGIGNGTAKKHIERVDVKTGIEVDVGQRKEVSCLDDLHTGLFLHFAGNALLPGLRHVDEATRKVEGPLCRFFGTATHQQFVPFVQNQRHRGGRGIEIIDKTTVGAPFRLEIVRLKAGGAALRTVLELRKWMFHNRLLLFAAKIKQRFQIPKCSKGVKNRKITAKRITGNVKNKFYICHTKQDIDFS